MNTINEILVEILKLKKENKILKDIIKDLKDRNNSLKKQYSIIFFVVYLQQVI